MEKAAVKKYVFLSYLVFWIMVFGLCGTASMAFHASPLVLRILSNVCAWAPTIVLLAGFKTFCPGITVKEFYKKAFGGRIGIFSLIAAAAVTVGATLLAVLILSLIQGRSFGTYWDPGPYPFWLTFLLSITTGPTGEESGWRGYMRPYLNKKHSFIMASIIQGVIWAFWHAVLWFVDSDYMGLEMIPYIISNVIVMTGLCFIMNHFMETHDNLIYSIVIHFCFNFFYCFLKTDILFYVILSIVYIAVTALILWIRTCWKNS